MKEHLRFIESANLQKCFLLFPTFVVQFYTNNVSFDNETIQKKLWNQDDLSEWL